MAISGTGEAQAVSVEEAAKQLGISVTHAKRLVVKGELPSFKLGTRRLVPVAAIDRIIEEALTGFDRDA
jgi:excisionase family DNA binding protein